MRLYAPQLALALTVLIISGLGIGTLAARNPLDDPNENARGVVSAWNAAVETLELEDANFRELLETYKLNPPGRVLLPPDVRAAQKKRRPELVDRIIGSHQDRIRRLRDLRRFEERSQ